MTDHPSADNDLGTEPDFYSSRTMGTGDENRAAIQELAKSQNADGATYFRYTLDEQFNTLWVEGWKVAPGKKAAFNPPYTTEKP